MGKAKNRKAKVVVEQDPLLVCQAAIDRLKAMGFIIVSVSRKSEAVYLRLEGRHGVLRVSEHPFTKTPVGLNVVVATLTFRGHKRDGMFRSTPEAIDLMVWQAIGQYLERSATPKPGRYYGKKGTWENAERRSE